MFSVPWGYINLLFAVFISFKLLLQSECLAFVFIPEALLRAELIQSFRLLFCYFTCGWRGNVFRANYLTIQTTQGWRGFVIRALFCRNLIITMFGIADRRPCFSGFKIKQAEGL